MPCRPSFRFAACLVLSLAGALAAQTNDELKEQLRQAATPAEQWELNYMLARNLLAVAPPQAMPYAEAALRLAVELRDRPREAQSLLIQAEAAYRMGKESGALELYGRAREAAAAAGRIDLALAALESLQDLAVRRGDFRAAHAWSREQIALQGELFTREAREQRRQYDEARQKLADQERRERNRLLAATGGFVLLLMLLSHRQRRLARRTAGELAEKNAMIEEKRRRSDQLLLNILPRAVAAELTVRDKVAARRYERATVMFVDFVNFTRSAELLEPEVVVAELDYCFSRFDAIIGRSRIEKIKTVGDAYICASGLSDHNESPADMIRAALRMQDFLRQYKATRLEQGRPYFEARIGIHFGPVVAGIVGTKKFAYDIWGDAVNTAARMEEACEAGRINVSGAAQAAAAGEFQWTYRGKIAVKNKGEMEMYYVA